MKIFLYVKGNKVMGWGSTRSDETDIEIQVSPDHEVIRNPFIFTYGNGQLKKDEVYQQQLIKEQEEQSKKPTLEQRFDVLQQALDDMILGGM